MQSKQSKFNVNENFRDFRVFDFGCRAKSKTWAHRKFLFFKIKQHHKAKFFVLSHFSDFWILIFLYYQRLK